MKNLREWFAQEREKYKINLSGIEKGINIPTNSLHDFVKKGYVSKESYPAILQYAFEHGFKYQPNQTSFDIQGDVCEVFVVEVVGIENIETSVPFFISHAWKEYDEAFNPKAKKRNTPTLPEPKMRVVKVKKPLAT